MYGKVPVKGDFISRGLSRSVVDTLDVWFQQGLQDSRDFLGERWLDLYSVAPIWHFYLPAGMVSEAAWVGIWMPSADRVGRNFPLVVMDALTEPFHDADEIKEFFEWFMECEDILLAVFDEDVDFDSFCNRICEKNSFRKIIKEADIDDVFEQLGASGDLAGEKTTYVSPEEKDTIEEKDELAVSKDSHLQGAFEESDPFTPSTPLEKALMLKVELLENIVQKLCQTASIDYEQELEGFIANLTPEQKAWKTQIEPNVSSHTSDLSEHVEPAELALVEAAESAKEPPTFALMKNVLNLPNVYSDADLLAMGANCCIWLSEGSDDIGPQLVFTETLPDSQDFHQFLSGFTDV